MAKIKDEELLTWVKADIQAADNYYEEEIEPACLLRLRRFLSDPTYYKELFPHLSERSSLTMSDVADAVYWILPALMKIFFGSDDVVSITGRTKSDDPEPMKALCNWQIQRKNKGFLRFYKWFLDALILGHGVMKTRWERIEKEVEDEQVMTLDQFIAFDAEAEGVKFVGAEEQPDGTFLVTVKVMKRIKNQPIIDNVPVSECRWLPDTNEVGKCPFMMHKRVMTGSEIKLKVKAGEYKKVSDENLSAASYSRDQNSELRAEYYESEYQENDGAADLDKSRAKYWVNECYAKYDINDDGISEDVIITVIGEQVVKVEKNDLERPHFSVLSPYPDQYQLTGMGIDDFIGELQDIKVAMYRQVILNVANNNDRQMLVDDKAVNADDLRENRKYVRLKHEYIGKRKASDIVEPFPEAPLAPAVFEMMQQIDSLKENRTGVTKYNQGTDASSLNKTATGITAIMGAANQRIEMIARMFAETGVVDLFQVLVEMNTRYIDQEVVVRLTEGKELQIDPDSLSGEYDLDVAAGVGAGQRTEAVQNMMLLIGQIYPALAQLNVQVTPDKIAEAATILVNQMGYRDASKLIPEPEEIRAILEQQAAIQAAMMQAGGGAPGQPQQPPGPPQPPEGGTF